MGAISLDLMIAVFVSSLLRVWMGPGTWRAIHRLAYLNRPVALTQRSRWGPTPARTGSSCWVSIASPAVAMALAWRIRLATRQASVRNGPGVGGRVPPKHLALSGRRTGRRKRNARAPTSVGGRVPGRKNRT